MAGLLPGVGTEGEEAPEDDHEDDRPVDAAPPPESPAGSVRIALLESSQANQREDRADDPPHRIQAEHRESDKDTKTREHEASDFRGDVVEAPVLQMREFRRQGDRLFPVRLDGGILRYVDRRCLLPFHPKRCGPRNKRASALAAKLGGLVDRGSAIRAKLHLFRIFKQCRKTRRASRDSFFSPALARRAPRGLPGGLATGLLSGASVGLAGGAKAEAEGAEPDGRRVPEPEGGPAVPVRAVPAAAAVDAELANRC